MGTKGFTQRDVAREIMRGYGKLESRNIIENMKRDNKLSWIKVSSLGNINFDDFLDILQTRLTLSFRK